MLSGFELYPRWVPLTYMDRAHGPPVMDRVLAPLKKKKIKK